MVMKSTAASERERSGGSARFRVFSVPPTPRSIAFIVLARNSPQIFEFAALARKIVSAWDLRRLLRARRFNICIGKHMSHNTYCSFAGASIFSCRFRA